MLKKYLSRPRNLLIIILLFTALTRLFNLWYPSGYVFDEVYHAFTAKEFLAGHQQAWEWWNTPPPGVAYEWTHPPLAKEAMALSMLVVNSVAGWAYRLPGVLLGVIGVYLVYALGKRIFNSEKIALTSAFLFSIDGLNFVQSRTGMNDIYFVTFMLATLLFFLNKKYFISAIFLGLALASKWTGFYLFGFIILLYFIQNFRNRATRIAVGTLALVGILIIGSLKLLPVNFVNDSLIPFYLNGWTHLCLGLLLLIYISIFKEFRNLGIIILVSLFIYLLAYLPFFIQGHSYKIFTDLQEQMWWYHSNLKASHDYSSPAWSWPFNLYPVWYFVDYHQGETFTTIFGTNPKVPQMSNIFASGNPLLFIFGFAAILVSLAEIIKPKERLAKLFEHPLFIPLLGYLVFLVPWLFSPRIMFLYHYSPSISFMSLVLGYQIQKMAQDFKGEKFFGFKIRSSHIVIIMLGVLFLSFIFVYPILVGLPLPKQILLFFFHTNLTKNPFGWGP